MADNRLLLGPLVYMPLVRTNSRPDIFIVFMRIDADFSKSFNGPGEREDTKHYTTRTNG